MRKLLFLRVGEKFRLLHAFLTILDDDTVVVLVNGLAKDVVAWGISMIAEVILSCFR